MGALKTVMVEDGDGCKTINEEDFDKKVHKIYEEKAASAEPTIADIKAELDELEVDYAGVTKKADLAKLLSDAKTDPAE